MTAPVRLRPILFSTPMVRALLEGRKTQTRRIINGVPPMPDANCHEQNKPLHPAPYFDAYCSQRPTAENPRGMGEFWNWWQVDNRACLPQVKVGYVPGDLLWVREAWRSCVDYDLWLPRDIPRFAPVHYEVDAQRDSRWTWGKYRHARFMPRRFSRLTLRVTAVRVQRLQDISEEDAKAEGCPHSDDNPGPMGPTTMIVEASHEFSHMWRSIHGPGSWESNPWVAAISFDVIRANVETVANRPICEAV
jgi:hypothetical protein